LLRVTYPPLEPAQPSDGKTLPDRIVEYFIARIFTGELPPGERLPADRELSVLLGVDRTSLRMATQQLARLGLVKVVHGSGVRVLDFREHAGLDFLSAVFALPKLSIGGSYVLEALDDWIDLAPVLVGRALARVTHEVRRELDAIMADQLSVLDAGGERAKVLDLEIALQDQILRIVGNTTLVLLGNSSRPLRRTLVGLFFETTDVREHVTAQRAMFRAAARREGLSAEQIAKDYRAYLALRTQALRERLLALPMNPSLVSPEKSARKRPARARARTA
jgi:DNA-binding FadR family transcriptional regulator